MIPRLKMSDWHEQVRESGERETARLEAIWAEDAESGELACGEAGVVAAAYGFLTERERDPVRRALLEGLRRAPNRAREGAAPLDQSAYWRR